MVVATLSNSWGLGLRVRVWSKEEQIANKDGFWSMLAGGVSVTTACEDFGLFSFEWGVGLGWGSAIGRRDPAIVGVVL